MRNLACSTRRLKRLPLRAVRVRLHPPGEQPRHPERLGLPVRHDDGPDLVEHMHGTLRHIFRPYLPPRPGQGTSGGRGRLTSIYARPLLARSLLGAGSLLSGSSPVPERCATWLMHAPTQALIAVCSDTGPSLSLMRPRLACQIVLKPSALCLKADIAVVGQLH